MKDIKQCLREVLKKYMPAFRRIEEVLADKEMSNSSKLKAVKWITLQLDCDVAEQVQLLFESYIEDVNDNSGVSVKYALVHHDFDCQVFLN